MSQELDLNSSLPGLYQSADNASLEAQSTYFWGLRSYLFLLIVAASIPYFLPNNDNGALVSVVLFLITLGILIYLRVNRPDDQWYNGRAVAESVKTRSWRWCMRAEPYGDTSDGEVVARQFINDLKSILKQNRSLSEVLQTGVDIQDPISTTMNQIRKLSLEGRLELYKKQRIENQAKWYSKKSLYNKRRAKQWFWVSVFLHGLAVVILIYKVKDPLFSFPVEVIATAAGAVLTWLQAKKHNELNSSYALTAHEIMLIKGEALSVKTESQLSDFVFNSETAFSREHTHWTARKSE